MRSNVILAATTALSFGCAAAHAGTPDTPAPAVGVSLKVSYADSFQGVSALFAVRACAYDERSGAHPRLVEEKNSGGNDVELQLFNENGAQVSRFTGSHGVCDYARFAAAYAARSQRAKAAAHE